MSFKAEIDWSEEIKLIIEDVNLLISPLNVRINLYLSLLKSILQKDTWQTLKQSDILLVRHDNDCGYNFHEKSYAHLIDTFGDLCEERGLSVSCVATPHSRLIGKNAWHSPVSYNQLFSLISVFGFFIGLLKGNIIQKEWIDKHYVDMWGQILERSKPKCVIGIQPDEYVCRAGKIKQIPVYDLQHGVIDDNHPWYGKNYRINTPVEKLPVGFLCWDDQSVTTLSKWACNKGIRVLKIGNPWFIRFYRNKQDDLLVNEAVLQNEIIKDNRPCILVSLQWGLANVYPDCKCNGVIADALEKVILDTSALYNWIVRLHPVQLRGIERKMVRNYLISTYGAENADMWIRTSDIPLPVILNKTDLHITNFSSIVIESAWMGIRSGLLGEQLSVGGKYQNYFSNERSLGIAEVIPRNTEEIKQWIIDTLAKGRVHTPVNNYNQNLDTFINDIGRKDS